VTFAWVGEKMAWEVSPMCSFRRILPLFAAQLFLLAGHGPGQQQSSLEHKLQTHSSRFGFSGTTRARLGRGMLRQKEERTFDARLTSGREYYFLAVCDNSCSDVDLFLRRDGFPLEEDAEPDPYPVVRFIARESGLYRLTLVMETCAARNCSFEVDQYSR
jgi:hypothetical protein